MAKYSPPPSPERVTWKVGEAKGQGFSLIKNRVCDIINRLTGLKISVLREISQYYPRPPLKFVMIP